LNTVVEVVPGVDAEINGSSLCLKHDDRHIRRKVIKLDNDRRLLFDFPEPVVLRHGDALVLDDGTRVLVQAAIEELFEVHAQNATHLVELAWHIGNRHLAAEIREDKILILRDRVIRNMLEKLGAKVEDTVAPFVPVRGAYSAAGSHEHHSHNHS